MMNRLYPNYDDVVFEYDDYAIQGKLVTASVTMSEYDMSQMTADVKDRFRHELATLLADEMIDKKLVEFTSMSLAGTLERKIMVRAYVAPDDTVRLLRRLKK